MISLPNVTLLQVSDPSDGAVRAMERSAAGIEFGDIRLLPARASYVEYNRFVISGLHDHFATSHVLLIQEDGFVWHPEMWTDEFLNFDYIGAVMWNGVVGNGGFSLRSRAFCMATSRLDLSVRRPLPLRLVSAPCDSDNEDMMCCIEYRELLEDGLRFASPEMADRFSWELSDLRPAPMYSFGLHGKHTLARARALNLL